MKTANQNTNKDNNLPTLDSIAESWVRLCIYNVRQKKELANKNKKAYEYNEE